MNIFIDTEDMEERYGEELYKEYLEKENQQLKDELKIKQDDFKCANEEIAKLKSTLEEIREFIKECISSPDEYENFISLGEAKHILQIIDKENVIKESDVK